MTFSARVLRILATTAFALVVGLGALAPSSFAGEQDFILVNATGFDIFYVNISPHNVNDWQEDVLGDDILEDGDHIRINFHRNETATMWDLRVMDEDENSIVWENLNLKQIYAVTVYYDANTGRAWAETESI